MMEIMMNLRGNWLRLIAILAVLILILLVVFIQVRKPRSDDLYEVKILNKIASADKDISYVGKELSMGWGFERGQVQEFQVIHKAPSTHSVKRLIPSERAGSQRRNRRAAGGPPPMMPMGQLPFNRRLAEKDMLELLIKNYDVHVTASEDKVAGYKTDLLTITPRVKGRPSMRIWAARDNHIILRSEDIDPDGNVRNMSVYTQISFKSKEVQTKLDELGSPPKAPEDPGRSIESLSLTEAQKKVNYPLVTPAFLPKGFQLDRVLFLKFLPKPSVHLIYTDGLASFSLFESKKADAQAPPPRGAGPQMPPPRDRPPMRERPTTREEPRNQARTTKIHGINVQSFDLRQMNVHIYRWTQAGLDLTLISDLSQNESMKVIGSIINKT